VCESHSGVAATGIWGNGQGGHPRGCSDGGSAVCEVRPLPLGVEVAAEVAMVEDDF
jgi:hypothetical protein